MKKAVYSPNYYFGETAKISIIPFMMVSRLLARFPTLALPRSGVRVLSQSSHRLGITPLTA